MTQTRKKLLIIAATIAGLSRNCMITLGAPAVTVTTETNPAYHLEHCLELRF